MKLNLPNFLWVFCVCILWAGRKCHFFHLMLWSNKSQIIRETVASLVHLHWYRISVDPWTHRHLPAMSSTRWHMSHEQVEVGSGELLMNGLQQDVVLLASTCSTLSPPSSTSSSSTTSDQCWWLELGGVCEAERRTVNQAVQSDERQGHGDDATQAAPPTVEDGDIRNNTEQRLGRPKQRQTGSDELIGLVFKIKSVVFHY